jgi:hypothetical protein
MDDIVRIADMRRESSLRVFLALHISKKPMTYAELSEETGLKRRSISDATSELRFLGLIEEASYNSPLYGEPRVEFRVKGSPVVSATKGIREMCLEADENGNVDAKVHAVRALFDDWFPASAGWGTVFPKAIKSLLAAANGSALGVYEGLEDSSANPEIRDDTKIKTRRNIGEYCLGILKNKQVEKQPTRGRAGHGGTDEPDVSTEIITPEVRRLLEVGRARYGRKEAS